MITSQAVASAEPLPCHLLRFRGLAQHAYMCAHRPPVNLQVEYFIHSTGGSILPSLTALTSRLRRLVTLPARPPITRKALRD